MSLLMFLCIVRGEAHFKVTLYQMNLLTFVTQTVRQF